MASFPSNPYTSAMITVPESMFANKRSDREIGIAISLIMLIGAQIGSHGGNGAHSLPLYAGEE